MRFLFWMGLISLVVRSIFRPAPLVQGFSQVPAAAGRSAAVVSVTCMFGNKKAGSFNPFTSLVGDMAASIMGSSVGAKPEVDSALPTLNVDSWSIIRSNLEQLMETDDERLFRQRLSKGYGVASPLHRVRLFDESNREENIRVTFYRDSASWCPYCQKVWLTLEEKRIPYRVEKVNMRCYGDKPAEFMRMQPSGQIPVAIIDGRVYGQSNDILNVLESAFPEHKSLLPPKGKEQKARELLQLERAIFSSWMYWLTSRDSGRLKQEFIDVLSVVEMELSKAGPFFMGSKVSTVDFMYTPFLERMAASLLYFKGFQMRFAPGVPNDYPALNRWFDAMEKLESYQLSKSDYFTHCFDLPPQLGGCVPEPDGEKFEAAITGERLVDGSRGSWELPLVADNGGVEPDWPWTGDDAAAKREAVERVSANFENIVKFAARGAGKKGMPPVSAPLADPNAVPSEAVMESVDIFLRICCLAMLEGTDQHESKAIEAAHLVAKNGGAEFKGGVIDSLAYLRDRVGVPRDMRLPAARNLRAHLNWVIEILLRN